MLHRFLFVAGMTVGVMTPLVWTAYVSRPVPHGTPAIAKATPDTAKPAPATPKRMAANTAIKDATGNTTQQAGIEVTTTEDVTASIAPASIRLPPPRPAALATRFEPSPPPRPVGPAKLARPHAERATPAWPRRVARRAEPRRAPAVVSRYNGAHIITVCAALTMDEQLRAGCP